MTEAESKIIPREIEQEMQKSYLDYAMSVIVGRALPDVRDGLKPVHRRILFAMRDLGLVHNKPFKKSARVVGEVLGKYHPHGDVAVYDSLVRMAQSFSLRYPLIDGQGNFGSVDADSAAAMRYTECRLTKVAEEILADIDSETVDFVPNFDGTLQEPTVLPSKIPNLLINGSAGIAVGMATNIPPHNMSEVCEGLIQLIDNPELTAFDLMRFVKGPDFPTGASIMGMEGIKSAYNTGRGIITIRAKTKIEDHKGRKRIIVDEIPYQVNKAEMIKEMADLVNDKKIPGISDLRDESDRDGMRVVIELKRDENPELILNQLYKHSKLEQSFGIIMLALIDGEPKVLNLRELMQAFISHRQVVVRRRTAFELKKSEERAHILEGLIIALNDIDAVVQKIKKSKDAETATQMLIADYSLDEIQAKAILDMKLQRLASLEQQKIRDEHAELMNLIEELKSILASEKRILDIIKKELEELKDKYSDPRKTELIESGATEEITAEQLIKEEEVVVTVTHSGYVKRIPVDSYKQQKRGGKGVIAAETKEEDWVEHLFTASTHSSILFFTNKGKVHWLKVYEIPEASRIARGKAIVNLLNLKEEKIAATIPVKLFDDKHFIMLCTKKGTIKKTNLAEFSNPRKGGIIAAGMEEGDELVAAVLTDGAKQIILATANGQAVRFNEEDVRSMGRAAKGVIGADLRDGDEVVGMVVADEKKSILTIAENGYGKRSMIDEYRLISRGGVGVTNMNVTDKTGKVVTVAVVDDLDEVMCVSEKGIIIRTAVKDISVIGRNTQGVRVMKLDEGDKCTTCTKIAREETDVKYYV